MILPLRTLLAMTETTRHSSIESARLGRRRIGWRTGREFARGDSSVPALRQDADTRAGAAW